MNNNSTKTFEDVKVGDTIYKVCLYNYKTIIIKKKVKSFESITNTSVIIHCECKDSEYYQNMFPRVPRNTSLYFSEYSPNTYLCTDIENARLACHKLAIEIISNTEKQISKLSNRLKKWRIHKEELYNGNYVIK